VQRWADAEWPRSVLAGSLSSNRFLSAFLLLTVLVACEVLHAADLTHSGPISADTTWLAADQHLITGDITVPAGVTLTVEPGAVVRFRALNDDQGGGSEASRPELIVSGNLVAVGTAGAPIRFTSDATTPAAGDWGGIRQSGGNLTLERVTVEYATEGVNFLASGGVVVAGAVRDSVVRYVTRNGIWMQASGGASVTATVTGTTLQSVASDTGSTYHGVRLESIGSGSVLAATVTGNTVDSARNAGLYLYSNSPTINTLTAQVTGNTVSNITAGHGISVSNADAATVSSNQATAVGGYGVYVDTYAASTLVTVSGNTVTGSNSYGVYVAPQFSTGSVTVSGNTVTGARTTGLVVGRSGGATPALTVSGNVVSNTVNGSGMDVSASSGTLGTLAVTDNQVSGSSYGGLSVSGYSMTVTAPPVVRGNRIYNNGSGSTYDGLQLSWTSNSTAQVPALTLNEVYGNTGRGLYLNVSGGGVHVVYNDVHDNTGNGVYLGSAGAVAEIHENNLVNNGGGYQLYNNTALAVAADANWWGATLTAEMAAGNNPKNISGIYDIYNNAAKGTVRYEPWLTAARVLAPQAVSWVRLPADGATLKGPTVLIEGSASAAAGISRVEVSTDGGVSWAQASGTVNWSYTTPALANGTYPLRSRVVTLDSQLETPGPGSTLTIDSSLPTTSGTLTTDETWSGTVAITGDITVPAGVTLTVQEGTVVTIPRFKDSRYGGVDTNRTEFVVNGNLLINGSPTGPVEIGPASAPLNPGDWDGIVVRGSLVMNHAIVDYARIGIRCLADAATVNCVIRDSLVDRSAEDGIAFETLNAGRVIGELAGNTVRDSGGDGLDLQARNGASRLDLVIDANTLERNATGGAVLTANGSSGDPVIAGELRNNVVSANVNKGIFASTTSGAISNLRLLNNTVFNNGNADGISIDNSSAGAASTFFLSGNSITGNRFAGIRYYNQSTAVSPTIQGNVIQGNLSAGLHLSVGGSSTLVPVVQGNTVTGNGIGLFLGATAAATVSNNEFSGSTTYDVQNDSSFPINAQQNWWGVTTTNDLNTGSHPRNLAVIYDSYDAAGKGTVDYSSWLTTLAQPTAPTVNPVTSPVTAPSQVLSGSKSANAGIRINGVTVVAPDATTAWSTSVSLVEGRNALVIVAVSAAGMLSSAVEAEIVRDTQAPRILSSNPVDGSVVNVNTSTVQLTLYDDATAVDMNASLATASIRLGAVPVAGSWSVQANRLVFAASSVLVPGAYTVTVSPVDTPLGNAMQRTVGFTVDTDAPVSVGLNPVTSPTRLASQTLSGTKEADTAIFINNGLAVALNGNTTWSGAQALTEGVNNFSIVARDAAGNASAPVEASITLDTVAPSILGIQPTPGSYINTQPAGIVISVADATSGVDLAASAATAAVTRSGTPVGGTWSLPGGTQLVFTPALPFVEGTYAVSGSVKDRAGNSASAASSFTYDATAPPVPVVNPVTSPTTSTRQVISGTKEAGAGIVVNDVLVISPNDSTGWSYDAPLAVGTNLFSIAARDRAGNQGDAVTVQIVSDYVSPQPVVQLTVDAADRGTIAQLDWSAYDESGQGDVASYRIYIQGSLFTQTTGLATVASVAAGTKSYQATGLTKGATYYFAVVAVDTNNNANISVTPVVAAVTDEVPPPDPTGVAVQAFNDQLRLQWTASLNTDGDLADYRLYIGQADPVAVGSTTTSHEFTGLEPATSYSLKITARDADGNESGGVMLYGVTLLPNPTGLTVQPFSNMVELGWNPVAPAGLVQHYALYAETAPYTSVAGRTPRLLVPPGTTVRRLAGLTNGTTYYFAVTTINTSGGQSPDVTPVPGTPVEDEQGPDLTNITFNGSPLASGDTITRSGTIGARASDPSGMSRVEFLADATLLGVDTNGSGQYAANWDIAGVADGPHIINVVAYDTLGNVTEVPISVTVDLEVPETPVITSPASGYVTNQENVLIAGTAEPGSEVYIIRNLAPLLGPLPVGEDGDFSASAPLLEGNNALRARAANRGGQGDLSEPVIVTRDSSIPDAPVGLSATGREGGEIRLQWSIPAGAAIAGYDLYRATVPFSNVAGAQKLNTTLLAVTSFTDQPPADGRYYYRAVSVNELGTPSEPSNEASAVSDSTPPRALSIQYAPAGPHDTASGRIGVGQVDLLVTVSEQLTATPFLSITPPAGAPITVSLSRQGDLAYTGSFNVTANTATGPATAAFSARDVIGNRGTDVDAGSSLLLDTDGPVVVALATLPATPVKNDVNNPAQVQVNIDLDAELQAGQVPELRYQLSAVGRPETAVTSMTQISPLRWTGNLLLPGDAGLTEVEMLQFFFSATDDLGNVGEEIRGASAVQVYQGNLPPLEVPGGLTATAKPGGQIRLEWLPVDGAAGYQIYRKGPGDTAFTEHQRTSGTDYMDSTPVDGLYGYTIASIRHANGEDSLGAQSAPAEATADSGVPEAPTGLTAELAGAGVVAMWSAPGGESGLSYSLYRAVGTIVTVAGLAPAKTSETTTATDGAPDQSAPYYAVTAMDAAGNQSPPSASVYVNVDLLPVNPLQVTQTDDTAPVVTWGHAGNGITGYKVYAETSGQRFTLTPQPIAAFAYTDNGYAGEARRYVITAVDGNTVESVERAVLLPAVTSELASEATLRRGLMNKLTFNVTNRGTLRLDNLRMVVKVDDHQSESAPFEVDAGASQAVPVIVGGRADLPAAAMVETTLEGNSFTGEQTRIVRHVPFTIADGSLTATLETVQMTRGASGILRFSLHNTNDVELDLVTARSGGAQPSDEIRLRLLDEDGNTLSVAPFRQVTGGQVLLLPTGAVIARIPAGASFASADISIDIPATAPDRVLAELEIDHVHYRLGTEKAVSIEGPSTRRFATLADVPYRCELASASPQGAHGNQQVLISGSAIDTQSSQALIGVPLTLVIETRGFERSYEVFSGEDGGLSFTFDPLPGEAGVYRVSCIHPDRTDRPAQQTFTLRGLSLSLATVNLQAYVGDTTDIPLRVTAPEGAGTSGARLVYLAADQPDGTLPAGITVDLSDPVTVPGGETRDLPFQITADESVAPSGSLVLKLRSNETGSDALATVRVDYFFKTRPGEAPLAGANPALTLTPNLVETGVARNAVVTETITLENIGFADLEDVKLALVNLDGSPITNGWAFLSSTAEEGLVPVGSRRAVQVSFSPPAAEPEGIFQFKLRATSANHPTREALVVVSVTDSGLGNALFKVSDIYTATQDAQGNIIEGLANAQIRMQNERVLTVLQTLTTNAQGEAQFSDLPSGWYKFVARAPKHQQVIGRLQIKPGITARQEVFLYSNLVTFEWSVEEITIEDRYDITLNATFETDVPAPVVMLEPESITLPVMDVGDVYYGQITMTNYGLVRADDVEFPYAGADNRYRFEVLATVPNAIESKQRVVIPIRITRIGGNLVASDQRADLSLQADSHADRALLPISTFLGVGTAHAQSAPSPDCEAYQRCVAATYQYVCANGTAALSTTPPQCALAPPRISCGLSLAGAIPGASGGNGSGGGGGGGFGGFGGGGATIGKGTTDPVRTDPSFTISTDGGVPVWTPPDLPPPGLFCPVPCTGSCCQGPGGANGPGGK